MDSVVLEQIAKRLEQRERQLATLAEVFDRWLDARDNRNDPDAEEFALEDAIRPLIGLRAA